MPSPMSSASPTLPFSSFIYIALGALPLVAECYALGPLFSKACKIIQRGDALLRLQAGQASIINGFSFQLATSTTATLTPSTATWGDLVLLEIYCNSLNPAVGNLTGSYTAYVVGGAISADTTTNVYGGKLKISLLLI